MGQTTKRPYGPALLSNAAATKYTVPTSTKAIVRWLHLSNNDQAVAQTFYLSLGADAAGTRLWDAYAIAAGAVYDWYPLLEMDAAEIIQAYAGTTNKLNLTIVVDEITL